MSLANKAYELYDQGKYQEALATLDRIIESEPKNCDLEFNRILILSKCVDPKEELRELEAFCESWPDEKEAQVELATSLLKLGNYTRAEQVLQDIDKDYEPGICAYVMLLVDRRRYEEAKDLFDESTDEFGLCNLCAYNIGVGYSNQKQYGKAILVFEKLSELEYDAPDLILSLGRLYWMNSQFNKAIECYTSRRGECHTSTWEYLLDLGVLLMGRGQLGDAKNKLIAARELMTTWWEPHFYLGEIALKEGDYSTAAECYESAQKLNLNGGLVQKRLIQVRKMSKGLINRIRSHEPITFQRVAPSLINLGDNRYYIPISLLRRIPDWRN